jgi:hypothetical protein
MAASAAWLPTGRAATASSVIGTDAAPNFASETIAAAGLHQEGPDGHVDLEL